MLRIRPEQMQAFSEAALKRFEDMMVAHLKRCFSEPCKGLQEPDLRKIIQYGIKRASAYGIAAERDVCKYVDIMMVLGCDFDKDAKLPWGAEILKAEYLAGHPDEKMSRLYDSAMEYLERETHKRGTAQGV